MGWWSEKQKTSRRWGGVKKGTKMGPWRTIVAVLFLPDTIMSPARVRYECGHEGSTWIHRSSPSVGDRGHCKKCIEDPCPPTNSPSTDSP